MKFGAQLNKEINLNMSDGNVFKAKYKSSQNCVKDLKVIFKKYDTYSNCVIFFDYVGNSTFNVSIYDSLGLDILKDVTGEFIADIVKQMEMEVHEISDDNEEDLAGSGFNNF